MDNIEETRENVDSVPIIGKPIRDIDNNSAALIIPKEFAKALDIDTLGFSMSLLDDFDGNKHLVVSKYHHESVID